MNVISIEGVSKTYTGRGSVPLTALQNINLEVSAGEMLALLGANGAGKTTLINVLAGLVKLETGTVKICGHDIQTAYQAARRSLGVVPQELVFDPFFTVRETLLFQLGYFSLQNDKKWIDELLCQLHLEDKADTNMRALSGGMKRRVMVAQALVHRPPVIILDEPSAGVDVALRQSLWQFVRDLNRKGHTILLTTHYLEEAENLCNRVAMLKKGCLVAVGNTRDFIQQLANSELMVRTETGRYPDNPIPHKLQDGAAFYALNQHDQIAGILNAIRNHGETIKQVAIKEADLEDVFLQITQ